MLANSQNCLKNTTYDALGDAPKVPIIGHYTWSSSEIQYNVVIMSMSIVRILFRPR